jgi:peptidoglycan-N-acetylglucosamine deacetylase
MLAVLASRGSWCAVLVFSLGVGAFVHGNARACLLPTLGVARSDAAPGAPSADQLGAPSEEGAVVTGTIMHRMLHFTFDDGPDAANTLRLLDDLDRAGIKATFFFSTSRFASRERRNVRSVDVAREVARRGHHLGSHGYDHVHMARLRPPEVRSELDSSEAMFLRAFGTRTYWFRPPYGSRNSALERMLKDGKYVTVMWNVGLADWVAHDPEELRKIFWRVLARNEMLDGERGGVVLLHDSHDWSVTAFERIIASIADRNCELLARGEELYDIVDSLDPWLRPLAESEYAARQAELRNRTQRRCSAEPEQPAAAN